MNNNVTTSIPPFVRKFIPIFQQKIIMNSEEFADAIDTLTKQIESLPNPYETDGQGSNAIAYLHYFKGGSDWYITERDSSDEQLQAFGLAVLNQDWQNAEMGYINIEELKQSGVEIDLYWTPVSLKEIRSAGKLTKEVDSIENEKNNDTIDVAGSNVEMVVEPNAKEEVIQPMINLDEIQLDNSSPLEEKNIQNGDLTTEPYVPTSLVCDTVDTSVPVSMMYEMNKSLTNLNRKVRGIDWYVCQKLGYDDLIDLCIAYSAEQVDAIATAIYQIEKGSALIVGDQTGIGKGRIGAAIMRYAKRIGKKPIIFTEKANLFSDIYRDVIAIGLDAGVPIEINTGEPIERVKKITKKEIFEAIIKDIENNDFDLDYNPETLFKSGNEDSLDKAISEYRELYFQNEVILEDRYVKNENYERDIKIKNRFVPFIINNRDKKTDIKDVNGNIIYRALEEKEKGEILDSKILPEPYDCVILTYSQVSNPKLSKRKTDFIKALAVDNIIIMDESQNASGASNTGKYLIQLLEKTLGVTYLSATFAKRPDNMPVYAVKTAMRDTELDANKLIDAITSGGVPLQEIVSSQLVGEGQMIRRERSYEGIDVNYVYLNDSQSEIGLPQFDLSSEHRAISDKITSLVRRIINFQEKYVLSAIEKINEKLKKEQSSAAQHLQQKDATINNTPIFSGIFQLINQLLFSIKAEAVADYAIMRMKQGKKPIIAFSSTLESFLDYLAAGDSDTIPTDYSVILRRRLEKVLEYTINYPTGVSEKFILDASELGLEGELEFDTILEDIENTTAGISVSPIDKILTRIKEAGYEVGEVTGRNRYVEFLDEKRGIIKKRTKQNASDLFRKFNNNQIDCLLINQTGATGASAHAIKTDRVYKVNYDANGNPIIPTSLDDKTEVKQRVMIILQAELDINKEVQKRGRNNRTGQVFKPIYDYLISNVPAEMRSMMILQRKLKSLDANTTSNQKQSKKILDVVDFFNIYGDEKVVEFLESNPEINKLTGNIVKFENGKRSESTKNVSDIAYRLSGRVAILPVEMQEEFYNTVSKNYASYEKQLKDEGKWNLEVERLDLRSKTVDKTVISVGSDRFKSVFGGAVFLEKCEVNNLRRPYSYSEMMNILNSSLNIKVKEGDFYKEISATPEQITEHLNDSLFNYCNNLRSNSKNSWKIIKEKQLNEIEDSKQFRKLKNEAERFTFKENLKTKILENYEQGLASSLKRIDELEMDVKKSINFFIPKRLVAYPFEDSHVVGICTGLKFNYEEGTFTRSSIDVQILIPNSIKRVLIPLSSQMIQTIMQLTNEHLKYQNKLESQVFIDNWDFETANNRSERVFRSIVTGNILKAYGMPEYSRNGKLISYTTSDNQIKKGILLGSDFEIKDLRVNVPLNKVEKIIYGMSTNQMFYISNTMYIAKTPYFWRVYVSKYSNTDLFKNQSITLLAVNDKWEKQRTSEYYYNDFEQEALKKVLDYLYSEFKISASIPASVFESIKDQFDISDRTEVVLSQNELLSNYNTQLDEYEKEQEFKSLEEDVNTQDVLEKELYESKKEIAQLKQIKRWYKLFTSLSRQIVKKKLEKTKKTTLENGGELENSFESFDWESLFKPLANEEAELMNNNDDSDLVEEKNKLAEMLRYGNPSTAGNWKLVVRDIVRTIKNEWSDMVSYYKRGKQEAAIDSFKIAKEQIQMLKNLGYEAKEYAENLEQGINEALDFLIFKKAKKNPNSNPAKDFVKISDLDNQGFDLINDDQQLFDYLSNNVPSLLIGDSVSEQPYLASIGGAFVKKMNNGVIEKIYVYEGDSIPESTKFIYEVYPSNTYIKKGE